MSRGVITVSLAALPDGSDPVELQKQLEARGYTVVFSPDPVPAPTPGQADNLPPLNEKTPD